MFGRQRCMNPLSSLLYIQLGVYRCNLVQSWFFSSCTIDRSREPDYPWSMGDFPMSCHLRKRNSQPLLTVKYVSLIINFSRRALALVVIKSPVTGNVLARATWIMVSSSCSRARNFASLKHARFSVTVDFYCSRRRQIDFAVGGGTEKVYAQSFKDISLFLFTL